LPPFLRHHPAADLQVSFAAKAGEAEAMMISKIPHAMFMFLPYPEKPNIGPFDGENLRDKSFPFENRNL
jgi:hypothetical protein